MAHKPSHEEMSIISNAGFAPSMYEVISNLNGVLTIKQKNGEMIRRIRIKDCKEMP